MIAAHNEARDAGHDQIRPAHLVLGLLSQGQGVAAKAIEAGGTSLDAVRAAALATLPGPAADPPELVPYASDARKTLEVTFREALRLGHNYIGTEHVLLALLETEPDGGVLAGLGLDKATIEGHIAAALDQPSRG